MALGNGNGHRSPDAHGAPRAHSRTNGHTTPGPIPPHGGELVSRWVDPPAEERRLRRELARAPRLPLTPSLRQDLWLLATGAFSPLTGFVNREDHAAILTEGRLADGTVWPMPIELLINEALAHGLGAGERVGLWDAGELLGSLDIEEIFPHDHRECARRIYGTEDPTHPGVARLFAQRGLLVAGPVRVFRGLRPVADSHRLLTPAETRAHFDRHRWATVVGFQTRNPIHRAHEFIQKAALETVDGLLLHPLVGETKADDIPAGVRLRTYEALIETYYPSRRTLLSVLPVAMRYAGPREAIFHALVRKNFGCTHFIVGRDHAGVGSFYGTYEAQEIFSRFSPGELGILPLKFEHTFFCRTCDGMASIKTCPHAEAQHVVMSETRLREMLRNGEEPPKEIIRPEVARILVASLKERDPRHV